ncbi:MAG TPA: hypothetical protein PKD61_26580, partial [Polyangiaceae bacterium]|nr:hypothetical protein [Polyangiaceae bacterium]
MKRLVFGVFGACLACSSGTDPSAAPAPAAAARVQAAVPSAPVAKPAKRTCRERIADLRREKTRAGFAPPDPGRAELLARAKAEPVLFLRAPRVDETAPGEVLSYRRQIDQNPAPGYTFSRL